MAFLLVLLLVFLFSSYCLYVLLSILWIVILFPLYEYVGMTIKPFESWFWKHDGTVYCFKIICFTDWLKSSNCCLLQGFMCSSALGLPRKAVLVSLCLETSTTESYQVLQIVNLSVFQGTLPRILLFYLPFSNQMTPRTSVTTTLSAFYL